MIGLGIALALMALGLLVLWLRQRSLQRERFIREHEFPRGLFEALRRQHPALGLKECQLVAKGLRQFFLAYLRSGHAYVSMPSQVVDDLWHAFILHTRNYEVFCQRAFGRFLHHTPAVALGDAAVAMSNSGLRRVWWFCCREENINPRQPTRLPLLFALDAKLGVAGGFHYRADCTGLRRGRDDGGAGGFVHCGGDFSDASLDGGTEGLGDAASGDGGGGGGDGGGDGGGCGGGGCGS